MSQGDGLRERLAEIIERQLGYTNGWSVPEEMYKDDCLKAADSILDLLSTSGEPVEPSAVVTCLVLGCYGIPQDGFKACAPHADRMRDKGMTVPVADSPPEPSTEGESTPTGERPPLGWSKELTRTLIDLQDSRMGLTEALQIVQAEYQRLKAIGEPQPAEPVGWIVEHRRQGHTEWSEIFQGRIWNRKHLGESLESATKRAARGWTVGEGDGWGTGSEPIDYDVRVLPVYTTPQPPDPPEDDGREELCKYSRYGLCESKPGHDGYCPSHRWIVQNQHSTVAQGDRVSKQDQQTGQSILDYVLLAREDGWQNVSRQTVARLIGKELAMARLTTLKDTGEQE